MTETNTDKPVLFAYDGSDFAKYAIEFAGLNLVAGRAALVLTVWQPFDSIPFFGAPFAVLPQEYSETVAKRAGEMASEGASLAREAGFAAEPLVEEGLPIWRKIVEAVEEQDAALTVIGSHGRSRTDHLILGSVTNMVAQRSKRPVLIAHLP